MTMATVLNQVDLHLRGDRLVWLGQLPSRTVAKLVYLGLLTLLACLIGCAQSAGPATVPVTGTITMDGKPIAGAVVVFSPQGTSDESRLATQAETDSEGRFELKTYLGGADFKLGVPAGDYAVSVSKLEVVQDMRRQPKNLLPKKYNQPNTSGFSATVDPSGENDFTFDL